ncbi:MAG: biopolymer transporter ExbD [Rhodobacteraceae bacterium]|nr:biopolymer transporter ExbD [Paracoccaceae bacterium]
MALINVVFLMLVFFLVAGQVARPVPREVELVEADFDAARAPDDALVLRADGTTLWRGQPTEPEVFAASAPVERPLRLLPDRSVPAATLIAVAARLRVAAQGRAVRLVTARSLAP